MTDITKSEVLSVLKKVEHPNFNREHLILNSIRNIELKGNDLSIDINLPMDPSAADDKLKAKLSDALKNEFSSLNKVKINIEATASIQKEKKENSILSGVKNTVAIASGKGGVGKSTVAVNLAIALAKDGAKVGLIDADVYGPSIPMMLGLKEKPKIFQDEHGVKIVPIESYGIKVISIGLLVDDNAPVIWRGPMASGAVKQFMSDVDWKELDYLIFDMPPGTGDIQLTLVQTIPLTGAIIVTTPQEISLIDARKALKMFTRVNVPVLGVIENMSYFIAPDTGKKYDLFGTGGGSKLASELNVPFLGGIPIDPRVRIGGDKGIPIMYDIPDSEHSKIWIEIAHNFVNKVHIRNLTAGSKVEIVLDDED